MARYRAPGRARIIIDPKARAYVYGVSIPVLALLVGIGTVTEGTAGLILNVIAGVLGMGTSALAMANTPAGSRPQPPTPQP